ncbi:MAG: M24 family metallopeptidase [Butyricicoccaceae bacterium]
MDSHRNYAEVQQIARETMIYIREVIRPGMDLQEVRRLCEEKMRSLGADAFWYWNIGAFVFSGDQTALSVSGREYETPDREIGRNDIVTIDLSPQRGEIWGDYARTIVLEDGRVVACTEEIRSNEWRSGLRMEEQLHKMLWEFVSSETTFEDLYMYMNRQIAENGFVNLDFLGNLGHSIEKRKEDRIYIERGNGRLLASAAYFTFEPHIGRPGSNYGFKKENIYYFSNGRLMEL